MDSESLQRVALEVPEVDEDFDPNFEPQDGEAYLQKVIYERKQCPAVVVKPLKDAGSNCQSISDSVNEFEDQSPEHMKPNNMWKKIQLETFNEARDKVIHLRETVADTASINFELPLIEDFASWKLFCQQNEPLIPIVLRISQRDLEKLLDYQSSWLEGDDSDNIDMIDLNTNQSHWWLGKWIYATLACLSIPLEPQVHSTLRSIVKSCVRLRNKLDFDMMEAARPYNLLIFLIAQFYGQLDLLQYV